MGGIAERIEDGGDVIGIESVSLKVLPAGIARYWAKAPGRLTRRRPYCGTGGGGRTAVAAVTAGDVAFARNAIALLQALHFRAELDDAAQYS